MVQPGNDALIVYFPGSRFEKLYAPDSLVTVVETTPVSAAVAFIDTPGINGPDTSLTDPVTVAKSPGPNARNGSSTSNGAPHTMIMFFICPPKRIPASQRCWLRSKISDF